MYYRTNVTYVAKDSCGEVVYGLTNKKSMQAPKNKMLLFIFMESIIFAMLIEIYQAYKVD